MMNRLIWVSKPAEAQTPLLTDTVLQQAHVWNAENGITGVLCMGRGVFLQIMEGERSAATRLYARISADPRHKDLELIHCESIAERRYGQWSMAMVSLSDVDPQIRIVWSSRPALAGASTAVWSRSPVEGLQPDAASHGRRLNATECARRCCVAGVTSRPPRPVVPTLGRTSIRLFIIARSG
ncbi:MAG: BLUF domain-containing protein [Rubrivivax sp.]|nr:BLUF domain-containing protein [Rubrivivax sp.]